MDNRVTQLQRLFSEGSGLLQARKAAEALLRFQAALTIDPVNPALHLYAGVALHDLNRYEEAAASCRTAIRIAPGLGEAHNNLGNTLMALGCFREAADSFSRAAELLPASPEPLAARATALQALGEVAASEGECRRALQLDPSFAAAHWNLALNLLLQGRYEEGWQEYEWRWQKRDFTSPVRHADIPLWEGSPLQGRIILLHAEQGFGDAIQFVRYAPLVARLGGTVVLECHPQLVNLMQGVEGVYAVLPFGAALPPCSCQAPLLSLSRIFSTTLQTIPAQIPYLRANTELAGKWSTLVSAYPAGLRVGLVWAGKSYPDPLRSIRLSDLAPLAAVRATFYSLQLGTGTEQASHPPHGMQLVDLTDRINDFADTAALIDQLDLVISIDTAVAHLAGALGKPAWVMLPYAPDWRWLLGRSDSPWYPAMRLFRQQQPGDWGSVVETIHTELTDMFPVPKAAASRIGRLDDLLRQGYRDIETGAIESAAVCFKQAEGIAPDMPDVVCGLAQLKVLSGKVDEAIVLFRRAIAADPDYYQCLLGLGLALQSMEQYEEAQQCYERALSIRPGYLQALNNLGTLLRATGKLQKAVAIFDRLVDLKPDDGDAHFNRSLVLLQAGRLREGWQEYEWRFRKQDPVALRHMDCTRWEGQPLSGKRILIHAEQGYGDTIQFVRYARLLSEQGAEVLVEAQDHTIAPLLTCADGVAAVYCRGELHEKADYQLPVMSLPLVCGTDLTTVPAYSRYIGVLPDKADGWSRLLNPFDGRPKIGLAWAGRSDYGNDRSRSIPFEVVSRLLECADVSWHSLQIGERGAVHTNLIDMTRSIHDFSDTAALISRLDLVVTVDTAVAHLAGALGIPVWLMLPYAPDWRWLLGRSDSPWYPSMRLFRQQQPGNWGGVAERIAASLHQLSHKKKAP